jgi:hypothetical protein
MCTHERRRPTFPDRGSNLPKDRIKEAAKISQFTEQFGSDRLTVHINLRAKHEAVRVIVTTVRVPRALAAADLLLLRGRPGTCVGDVSVAISRPVGYCAGWGKMCRCVGAGLTHPMGQRVQAAKIPGDRKIAFC